MIAVSLIFCTQTFSIFVVTSLHGCCILLQSATVLSFDEELSKTISLEQCKSVAFSDSAATTERKASSEKDIRTTVSPPVAKVTEPRLSISTPRQSKTSAATPRSGRSSAARSTRSTHMKSKSGFSKCKQHPSPSSSSSKLAGSQCVSSSCTTKKAVDSEHVAPKTSPKSDSPVADLYNCDAASISHLFSGIGQVNCLLNFVGNTVILPGFYLHLNVWLASPVQN